MPDHTVAFIPARGGSKGLPGKNLRLLAGKPLIAHSIEAGLGAKLVDEVYVSTEDNEIADVAAKFGAKVIKRPPELATDTAQNDAVLRHWLEANRTVGKDAEIVVLLQPTSPLRRSHHIDACVRNYMENNVASCLSVCAVDHHPGKCVFLKDGLVEPYTCNEDMEAQRQNLMTVYRQNGAIYVVGVNEFLQSGSFYRKPCFAYIMDRRDSVDIDDELDLQFAELIAGAQSEANT